MVQLHYELKPVEQGDDLSSRVETTMESDMSHKSPSDYQADAPMEVLLVDFAPSCSIDICSVASSYVNQPADPTHES